MYTLSSLNRQVTSDDYKANKRIKLSDGLTEFPQAIFEQASDVEILDLGDNQLNDLPDNLADLKHLRILFLTNNRFEYIPAVLSQCEKLEIIAFKANQLKQVDEHCLPKNTRWLILTENQIAQLPASMGELTQLKKLALAGNRLTDLPESMKSCTELELVRLSANQLSEIPNWLLQLPKLAWLAFSGNPISNPKQTNVDFKQSKFESFDLLEIIGEGASGIIHRAHCRESNQPVAVKLFKGDVTSDGYPKDEIHCCLTTGNHENLISVRSTIESPEKLGLVMDLISQDFKSLGLPPSLVSCTRDTFERNTHISSRDILKITQQMVCALLQMHNNKVSHGDIYAHNTMIDDQINVLFGDFGAATDLSNLTANECNYMQAIEVRALGYLMDDLLALSTLDTLYEALASIKESCLDLDLAKRPSFADLEGLLAQL